jgi:transcriptional regulator with XRE-family HTH domain
MIPEHKIGKLSGESEEPDVKRAAAKIIRRLKHLGWNQKRLSIETGISESRISRWLDKDGNPKPLQFLTIARALEVSVEYLIDDGRDDCGIARNPGTANVPGGSRKDDLIGEASEPLSDHHRYILRIVDALGVKEAERRLLLASDACCVYFVEDRDTLLIKIGFTSQLKVRLSQIREKHPNARTIATVDGGRREERAIHRLFSRYRHEGEWFRPSPLIFEYLAANAVNRN